MSNFSDYLKEQGLPASRIPELGDAFRKMHRALSCLDNHNTGLITQRSLEDWLREYAKVEQMRDVFEGRPLR